VKTAIIHLFSSIYEHVYSPKAEDRQHVYRQINLQIQIPTHQPTNQQTKLNYAYQQKRCGAVQYV